MSISLYSSSRLPFLEDGRHALEGRVPKGLKNPLCCKLGKRLMSARERSGMLLSQVSALAAMSKPVAGLVERGEAVPGLDTLERIGCAIGVSPGWIAYGYEGLEPFRERYPRPIAEPSTPSPDPALRVFRDLTAGFPQRVREARERSGLSMRTLSSAAGVSVQAWSNAEAGKALPRVDTCERMAVALGVAPRWLAYGEGNAPN